ncbi:MAG: hypothetical protein H6Q71_1476 [Firmicutes bacterium]|nr:hypothetical protein [Bacillota bacterium]
MDNKKPPCKAACDGYNRQPNYQLHYNSLALNRQYEYKGDAEMIQAIKWEPPIQKPSKVLQSNTTSRFFDVLKKEVERVCPMAKVTVEVRSKAHGYYMATYNGIAGNTKAEISRNAIIAASRLNNVPAKYIRVKDIAEDYEG